MAALNEKRLILWALKVCVAPCILISITATFFPYPQAAVPAHESHYCICNFLEQSQTGERRFPALDSKDPA